MADVGNQAVSGHGGDAGGRADRMATVVGAVGAVAASEDLARDLDRLGIPLMILKGPPLQQRLFGTEAAYRSADVDLLVPARGSGRVRRLLGDQGWRFLPENGLLWRPDRAVAFRREGITIDLHWGVHAGMLSPRRLRSLERALWQGSGRTAQGWIEPPIEPLLVYLAVHGAANDFRKPEALLCVGAAARLVENWVRVEAVARQARIWGIVKYTLAMADGQPPPHRPPLLDGAWGRTTLGVVCFVRWRLVPAPVLRAARALRNVTRTRGGADRTEPSERYSPSSAGQGELAQ